MSWNPLPERWHSVPVPEQFINETKEQQIRSILERLRHLSEILPRRGKVGRKTNDVLYCGVGHRDLGCHWTDISFQRHVAARHQHGNYHRYVPDGICDSEYSEPRQ